MANEGKVIVLADGRRGVLADSGKAAVYNGQFRCRDCCGYEHIPGNCCGSSCDEMPRFLKVTFSGIENCGDDVCTDPGEPEVTCTCEDYNATFICEYFPMTCQWRFVGPPYECGDEYVLHRYIVVYIETMSFYCNEPGYPIGQICVEAYGWGHNSCFTQCFAAYSDCSSHAGCGLCELLPLEMENGYDGSRPGPVISQNCCDGDSTIRCHGHEGTVLIEIT